MSLSEERLSRIQDRADTAQRHLRSADHMPDPLVEDDPQPVYADTPHGPLETWASWLNRGLALECRHRAEKATSVDDRSHSPDETASRGEQ